ncbi:MAG: hypothetical protein LBL47_00075, partial [Lactobacillus sp.]|nr:hypothetical protein [Lactobacillus sp.]
RKLYDLIVSDGEDLAVRELYEEFKNLPLFQNDLGYFHKDNIPIITDSVYGNANITSINIDVIREMLEGFRNIFFPGYFGRDINDLITTLGSNGSDTTAIALSAALRALCVIIKDTGAIYTADPKVILDALALNEVNLSQANILASLGSKIIHEKGAAYAEQAQLDIIVRAIDGQKETLISPKSPKLKFAGVTKRKVAASANHKLVKATKISVVGSNIGSKIAYEILSKEGYDIIHTQTPYNDEASSVIIKTEDKSLIKSAMIALHNSLAS